MNKQTIYFYATLGDLSKPAFGGGEVGNRRTLSLLKQIGYNVVPIPKYKQRDGHSIKVLASKFCDATANLWLYLRTLYKGNRANAIVHIAGFSGSMVYWALSLIYISKLLGYKTVFELRGGGIIGQYHSNSKLYRLCFDKAVCKADCIFSQGDINKSLIMKINPYVDYYYYPNYVERGFAPQEYPVKPEDSLNLIYFGRLSRLKNIELIIDIFNEVTSRIDIPISLSIIGNPESDEYFDLIQKKIGRCSSRNCIILRSRCPHDVLKTYLGDKHFYIFPTQENGEGHSNALTEAMTWGIIPIATNQGFNRDVIDCDELIVENLSVASFSNTIIQLYKIRRLNLSLRECMTDLKSCILTMWHIKD